MNGGVLIVAFFPLSLSLQLTAKSDSKLSQLTLLVENIRTRSPDLLGFDLELPHLPPAAEGSFRWRYKSDGELCVRADSWGCFDSEWTATGGRPVTPARFECPGTNIDIAGYVSPGLGKSHSGNTVEGSTAAAVVAGASTRHRAVGCVGGDSNLHAHAHGDPAFAERFHSVIPRIEPHIARSGVQTLCNEVIWTPQCSSMR